MTALRVDYDDDGAIPAVDNITAADMVAISTKVNANVTQIATNTDHIAANTSAINTKAAFLGSVSSQTAMLALTGNVGDYCNRIDLGALYLIAALPASALLNWKQIGNTTPILIDGGNPFTTGDYVDGGTSAGTGSGVLDGGTSASVGSGIIDGGTS